jgi:hypothetical protein
MNRRRSAGCWSCTGKGKLSDIRGLGPKRISEIAAALVFVGLDIRSRHGHGSG